MSQESFDALRPALEAISKPSPPKMPVHEGLMEAEALHLYLQEHPDLVRRLESIGVSDGLIRELGQAIEALRYAQARWLGLQSRRKPQARAELEAQARALRADALRACRWNLRHDPQALKVLARITKEQDMASFMASLDTLALLIEQHAQAFADDDTFDPLPQAQAIREARDRCVPDHSIRALERSLACDWRDRAWVHLSTFLSKLRAAAHYILADDPQTLARFQSSYARRRNQQRRPKQTPP